jgi:hypothetical protein
MKLDRLGSGVLFLQGVMPALVFGFWRPGGLFLLLVAVIYVVLAWGVWSSKRWALIAAIIFTVPQLFVISTKLFSWQFFIGGAFGAGVAPMSSLLDSRISSFFSLGARFDFAVSERCPSLLASFTYIRSETFVLLNVVALLIFAILLSILRRPSKVDV